MFKKKKCPKCKEKVNKDFDFCPNCGYPFQEDNQDWGMLGKNDFSQNQDVFENMFGGGILSKMIKSTMKMLEQEIEKEMKKPQDQNMSRTNFELYINGKKINPKNIQVTRKPGIITKKKPVKSKKEFSEKNVKKLSKLPRQEPLTNMKRFSDKIIYEINVPGVKSIDDVSIISFEESTEVKAIAKDKVYSKLIPLSLPILNYNLSKGKLILEFENRD